MFKGDIVLIPFPFTDMSGQKVRPAIVLYSQDKGEDCIVAFISSKKEKKLGQFDISIKMSQINGLKINSVIRVSKLATLQKKIILGKLGVLESPYLKMIMEKLKLLFK